MHIGLPSTIPLLLGEEMAVLCCRNDFIKFGPLRATFLCRAKRNGLRSQELLANARADEKDG
ncbi:MAG: hypothetical protein L0229_00555 [Blastocatellia bacterium]|nr:hypothetical protein [Blastocatellia bacterium]